MPIYFTIANVSFKPKSFFHFRGPLKDEVINFSNLSSLLYICAMHRK